MRKRNRPTLADQLRMVEDWNAEHQVGCPVVVTLDDGSRIPTWTESEALMLGGHTAVIKVAGISGCYSLARVEADTARKEAA